jgi:hypothetical protein
MARIFAYAPVLLFSTLMFAAAPAEALTQPDGTPIPQGNGLQGLFDSRGEAINALAEANTVPETFVPSCSLTFEVLQRNAGYQNSFGWYNVTGSPPTPDQLHEFLLCTDGVGTVKTLNIKLDPGYLGGEVGFYEATGSCATPFNNSAIFYSEVKYNPDANQANPYIHLLIYNSTVTDKAFYFGWEDLLFGGDNDFDDLTTFVSGISCTGGGGQCQTGQPGVCGAGTMQCQAGVLTCVQQSQPSPEQCDGVDNDCNGQVDDGDLCEVNEVCDQGVCVPACTGPEFPCPLDTVCNDQGYCVDPGCLDKTCGEGTKCVDGECVAPCDGVVCPHGLVCVVGVCLDPCVGITCDPEQVCVAGACIDHCGCGGCPGGETCQADGKCTPTLCLGQVCPPGQYCDASGVCVDACAGATCPPGQVCETGQCVPGAAGTGGGGVGQGGFVFNEGGGGASSVATGAGGASASASSGGSNKIFTEEVSACGCRLVGASDEDGDLRVLLGAGASLGLAFALARRSRRRRVRRS